MTYIPPNPNGQATMANSAPVVIASNQSAIPITSTELDSVIAPNGGTQPADGVVVMGHTGSGTVTHMRVDTNGVVSVNVNNSALPTGGATSAKQDTIIGHVDGIEGLLTTIDADTSALAGAVAGTEVQVDIVAPLPAGTNNIGDVDIASGTITTVSSVTQNADVRQATAANLNAEVQGDAAHDAAVSGNPVLIGGSASAAAPTSVSADGDAVRAWYLRNGAQATVVTAAGALIGGDATNGLDVDVTRVIPGTTATALGKAEDAAHATGDTGVMALAVRTDTAAVSSGTTGDYEPLHTDSVGALWTRDTATQVDDAAFTPATGRVMPVAFFADETATDSVDEGDAGAARMTLDRKQIVSTYAHTAGGATPYKLVSAATTNATSVKASAGTVYMITASNVNAAVRYLKLYNKASAPTVGTDTPVLTYAIPGNTAGAGTNIPIPNVGINFSTGIALALTTEATDAGTTAVAANEIVVNLAYA